MITITFCTAHKSARQLDAMAKAINYNLNLHAAVTEADSRGHQRLLVAGTETSYRNHADIYRDCAYACLCLVSELQSGTENPSA